MTAEAVERIVRSVLKQYGLVLTVRQVRVDANEWTVALVAGRSTTRVKGSLSSPYAVRTAVMKALDIEL
jgi:hypothetical protein